MAHVFIVLHEHAFSDGRDDVKLIGAYSSELMAQRAISKLSSAPGFRDTPEGFSIDRYEIDQDNWVEGYASV